MSVVWGAAVRSAVVAARIGFDGGRLEGCGGLLADRAR